MVRDTRAYPFVLLGIALFIALGFEFVNGFHDTANAVATVIYTHSLPPNFAVVWSGTFNFLGVLVSSGAVAFGIVSLLPVELILQVGSGAGFAMVFALLIAAILWNLGTWYFGLPASSSHTLIGSIMGVGLMNQLMAGNTGTSGVDWSQAAKIGESLLFSPLIGFSVAALLMLIAKALIPIPALFQEPKGNQPPPLLDSGIARPHLHGRELCAWLERRAEGHGSHHADPHRHRADRLRAEPHHARGGRRQVRGRLGAGANRAAALRQRRSSAGSRTPPPSRSCALARSAPQTIPALAALSAHDCRGKWSSINRSPRCPPMPWSTFATTCIW